MAPKASKRAPSTETGNNGKKKRKSSHKTEEDTSMLSLTQISEELVHDGQLSTEVAAATIIDPLIVRVEKFSSEYESANKGERLVLYIGFFKSVDWFNYVNNGASATAVSTMASKAEFLEYCQENDIPEWAQMQIRTKSFYDTARVAANNWRSIEERVGKVL
ncbi:hypothetical protein BO79DRAFT_254831 [Aspergillus costaricaensis CBS 115574]|uniref:Uncharacterized protein n=1 Tax=Aspergillus costaricaensis CBS 115574 TaxID=1448317 RepID=A0ACD1IEV4_9EURO|nr:hypothetical protein BO79DRAFT_254831 [Aspergillus costaricaensis CBS 115574]RAK88768.1 hypothetical protein BO79DRAFT_254831 [Aspergillus costaricaensis CBS 115574]